MHHGGYYGQQMQHAPPQMHMQQQPPSQHYGGYQQDMSQNVFSMNAWQAMNFSTEDDFARVFHQFKNPQLDGLQGQELHNILNTHPEMRRYYGISWSLELCKIMLAMMDRNRNGIMNYSEFRELLNCLVYWKTTFQEFDGDRSGYIEANELHNCIVSRFRYQLSQKTMETLLKRYSRIHQGRCLLAFDDFVSLCVRLRAYTEAFRARDRVSNGNMETGTCMFQYDDFLQCAMCL